MRAVPLRPAVPTSIGSLPHDELADAVEFVLDQQPELPAAPQLPHRHPAESMLEQAATGDDLSGEAWASSRMFLQVAAARHLPAVKLQLTGPVTAGLALARAGAPAEEAFSTASATVRAQASALVGLASRVLPEAHLVVFLDEPGLTGWGTPSFPLDGEGVEDIVAGALAALGSSVTTGVHCCGPTDLSLISGAGADIISVPVAASLVQAAGSVSAHLDRGGWIAWGAVPTDGPLGDAVDPLWRRLADTWCGLAQGGCDPVRLRRQSLITPACGLASHNVAQAAHVLRLTDELSQRAHSQAVAARLSVGA